MTNKIKNELSNFKIGSDYLVSVDDDKEIYTIYSGELKFFLREIIINHVLPSCFRSIKIEGHEVDGDFFTYEGGINELPDRFIANIGWEEKIGKKIGRRTIRLCF